MTENDQMFADTVFEFVEHKSFVIVHRILLYCCGTTDVG